MTVRQLLNHTSGIPDIVFPPSPLLAELYAGDRFLSRMPHELIALVADAPITSPPGSAWSYSNTGYIVAARMVERATGHPLASQLEQRIFEPLELHDTSVLEGSCGARNADVRGYSLDLDLSSLTPVPGALLDFTDYDTSRTWGSGNILSDVRDLATFFSALLRGSVISSALLNEMKQTVATGRFPDERAGLGLIRWSSRWGRRVWGKDGDTPGFSNLVLASEDGTRQVCIMVNAMFAPAGVEAALEQAIKQAVRDAFAH